jgi:flagellar biogenesis protein FliO
MPLPLIPIAAAAATTGAAGWWWFTKEDEDKEASFESNLWDVLRPVFIIILIILLLRWLYQKGSNSKNNVKK